MSKSEHLRLREVRAAFRLVGEVIELGADPHEWWPHLLEGLCRLTGAAAAIGGEAEGLFFLNPQFRVLGNFFARFDQDDVQRFTHFMVQEKWKNLDDAGERYYRLRGSGAPLAVRSAEQLMARQRWRRSEMFNDYFRPSRIDDRVFSFCHTATGECNGANIWNGITLFRGLGHRPFTARERRLLRLVHSELRPLVGTKVASLRGAASRPLSPRLRQTLDLILSGRSEKQIAEECGLAKSTVNEYVAALYRRYGVSSRAELMAPFLRWRATHRDDNSMSRLTEDDCPGESGPSQ
jgi:DNA-binding CsgD family transcriptional regulator